jgi:hypothetical protein
LQRRTVAAINAGRVPAELQEQLSGAVNDLASRVTCVPPRPAPAPAPAATPQHEHGHEHGHGKHKGHEHKRGKKHEDDG